MQTDIDIAQNTSMKPVSEIAANLGLEENEAEFYGKWKAKLSLSILERLRGTPDGKLVLVTAVNPTPAGEGKTTTTVGLGQALNLLGKKAIITLREPSLGPVMGMKGGAAGGGYSQVVPMEDINLHFTGDIHAVTAANNLLSAAIDNHMHQGNHLGIDLRRIVWKRALDMNDRALRNIIVGLGGKVNGMPREDGFNITVASEVMAVLCLSSSLQELKDRLGRMICAYTFDRTPVTASDLKAEGAIALLLKDAIKPNLVQTLENTPALMHGGPFANIAHGCNSTTATGMALKLADYVITEAGFGADLGAEKFFNIKCRSAGFKPDAAVLVATVRALKYNGGVPADSLDIEDTGAVDRGFCNLEKHIENIRMFGVPVIVCINVFSSDTRRELDLLMEKCSSAGVKASFSEVYSKGGKGGVELAAGIIDLIDKTPSEFSPLYDSRLPVKEKIEIIAGRIYGADGVQYSRKAESSIAMIEKLGLDRMPVCMAKTQYSLSDDKKLLGRPSGFSITVNELTPSAGAGFIVARTGDILTMPGLPKAPSYQRIDIDGTGKISGLF